ncbi:Mannose-6-phosphate receptor binding protein [Lasiodiplodia theobromae]|nr:Mannose-6-phosphate receptor binding protein [Lasiodiplodia theobromae]
MRRPQGSTTTATMTAAAALLLTAAFPSLVAGVMFDCKDVVVDGTRYDFHELGGPRSVYFTEKQPPAVLNTTFTVDICKSLKPIKGVDKKDQCPTGTRVCGVTTSYNPADNTSAITKVVPIAGNFAASSGGQADPRWTKLKGSDSNADAEKEGLRLELKGGKYPFHSRKGTKQKALIEFICDRNRTGTETDLDNRDTIDEEDDKKKVEDKMRRRMAKLQAREENEKEGDDEGGDSDDDDDDDDDDNKTDKSKALQFVSYKMEDDLDVLRLTWYTKYACEDGGDSGSGPGGKSEHWGFFTWVIIILFLSIAACLIFGSWLNYERYGARGWDAVPHGDTIRDLPYLVKDFGRRITSSFQGGGSRGGYSAV